MSKKCFVLPHHGIEHLKLACLAGIFTISRNKIKMNDEINFNKNFRLFLHFYKLLNIFLVIFTNFPH